jgi:hypothetical protein
MLANVSINRVLVGLPWGVTANTVDGLKLETFVVWQTVGKK